MLIKSDNDDDPSVVVNVAQFERSELMFGELLGSGGFSDVYAIHEFHLNPKIATFFENEKDDDIVQARLQLTTAKPETTARNNKHISKRYAVKILKESLKTKPAQAKALRKAKKHLCNEVYILKSLNHPNILKMRGLVDDDDDDDCSGIIVDRLQETLSTRIVFRWYQQGERYNNPIYRKLCDWKGDKRRDFLVERLSVGLGIARALAYLHDRNMIYRDLKPANIGFDFENQPILFDLGLCREMPTTLSCCNERFKMSGKTGTIRYMSPEVRMGEPYNEKADVYSFAHVLWEILSLEKPYANFSRADHMSRVVKLGERPCIDEHERWPLRIRHLLELCWDADPDCRHAMSRIEEILEEVIIDLAPDLISKQHGETSKASKTTTTTTTRRRKSVVPIGIAC